MIVIGICDGEQTVRSLVAGYVERYHAETGVEIQLLSYNTGEKLLKNYMLDIFWKKIKKACIKFTCIRFCTLKPGARKP